MTAAAIFFIACAVLIVAIGIKIKMTLVAQDKCMELDITHFLQGPEFLPMLFNPFRWTFAQHYPALAKQVRE